MNVTFTGDISFSGCFTQKVNSNSEIFDDKILAEFISSDFVVCNLEGPTTNATTFYNNNTPLKSPINSIKYLAERNISVFNLSNNHILDYGEVGLKDTLQEIKNEKCNYFGAELSKEKAKKPLIISKNNISIALFGICKCNPSRLENAQLFSSDEFLTLKKQINIYKNKVDFIVVNFHGGEEFTFFPSPVKRKFLKKLINLNGVSLVVAHHSHTFQGYEKHKNKFIFYSLGNFVFDIPNHKPYLKTDVSALLKINFTKDNFTFDFTPYKINDGVITTTNIDDFKSRLSKLNDFSKYKKKWQKEAYRVLFRKENPKLKGIEERKNSLQNKSIFSILTSLNFYIKALSILKDKYQFSLYFNAMIYNIKKKFIS